MSDIDKAEKVLIGKNQLNSEIKGHGHPLVFVHGGLVDSRMWDDQFKLFARQYTVVRYDLHGFGKSRMPESPFSPVEDLKSLLTSLQVERAHLIGLSLGGSIAIEFTLAHPSMVNRLVLASSDVRGYPPTPPDEETMAIINAVRQNEKAETVVELMLNHSLFAAVKDKSLVRTMLMDNYPAWTSAAPACFSQWHSKPAMERLSEIQSPTLILIGSSDTPDMAAIADTLEERIMGAVKRVLLGAGHHMNMEMPEEFNRVVSDFLREP
jgi:pimeloyl-ACP methyl ester carboxylesterase